MTDPQVTQLMSEKEKLSERVKELTANLKGTPLFIEIKTTKKQLKETVENLFTLLKE